MAVVEHEAAGSQAQFLASMQRFTDMALNRLGEAKGPGTDEKETRMLATVCLKALRIWQTALHDFKPAPTLQRRAT